MISQLTLLADCQKIYPAAKWHHSGIGCVSENGIKKYHTNNITIRIKNNQAQIVTYSTFERDSKGFAVKYSHQVFFWNGHKVPNYTTLMQRVENVCK